jgi:hypothetical protein
LIFTIASFIRSYTIRRVFNNLDLIINFINKITRYAKEVFNKWI